MERLALAYVSSRCQLRSAGRVSWISVALVRRGSLPSVRLVRSCRNGKVHGTIAAMPEFELVVAAREQEDVTSHT